MVDKILIKPTNLPVLHYPIGLLNLVLNTFILSDAYTGWRTIC